MRMTEETIRIQVSGDDDTHVPVSLLTQNNVVTPALQTPKPIIVDVVKKRIENWNRKVSREELIQRIESRIEDYRKRDRTTWEYANLELKRQAYVSIYLIQVMNGLRIGEACEALYTWLDTGQRVVKVKVEKKKLHAEFKLCPSCSPTTRKKFNILDTVCSRCGQPLPNKVFRIKKEPVLIPVDIPLFLTDDDRTMISTIRDRLASRDAIRMMAYKEIGVNTHTLRYSFVRMLRKQGKSPDEAAQIMRHSSSAMTKHYFDQEDEDENRLKYARIR